MRGAGGWTDGWMGGWAGGWVDGRMGEWMGGWVDGRVGGWVDGRMGGWAGGGEWCYLPVGQRYLMSREPIHLPLHPTRVCLHSTVNVDRHACGINFQGMRDHLCFRTLNLLYKCYNRNKLNPVWERERCHYHKVNFLQHIHTLQCTSISIYTLETHKIYIYM